MVEQPMKENIKSIEKPLRNDNPNVGAGIPGSPPSKQGRRGRRPLQINAKKKSSNFDLCDHIYNMLIPQINMKKVTEFDPLVSDVNFGDCALIVDTLSTAFIADTKGFNLRGISPPTNETVIRGSQEAFVENIRTNTSMLRRIINNENLIIEGSRVRECKSNTNYNLLYEKHC